MSTSVRHLQQWRSWAVTLVMNPSRVQQGDLGRSPSWLRICRTSPERRLVWLKWRHRSIKVPPNPCVVISLFSCVRMRGQDGERLLAAQKTHRFSTLWTIGSQYPLVFHVKISATILWLQQIESVRYLTFSAKLTCLFSISAAIFHTKRKCFRLRAKIRPFSKGYP